jgi:hypothetical protein
MGILALLANKGEWAGMFYMETGVSHLVDLFEDSWQDSNGKMIESNATRMFWTIVGLMGY